jgi:hypothetical protein
MKTRSEIMSKVRPHPQERENRSPASLVANGSFNLSALSHESPDGEGRQIDFSKSRGVQWLSPLPGGEGEGEGERNT